MPEATINGYRMHYEVYGQGQPLVMIHGGLGGGEGCAAMVEHHADALADRFRLVFYDRRAAGQSEIPSGGYSLANQVQDLHSLMQRLEITQAHVLGSSAGGPIATRFALDHPEMVDTLLLINTMSYASAREREARQRELEGLLANEAAHGREVSVERALEARNPGIRENEPGRFARLRAINLDRFDGMIQTIQSYLDIGDTIEQRLGELSIPTMVVHGDADTTIPVDCAYRLHECIGGSELHIIPGAVHGLMTNEADRVRNMVLDFLERSAVSIQPSLLPEG